MAKVKRLGQAELSQLRKHVLEAYAHRRPEENALTLNAYLPNYDDLKSDMVEALSQPNGAISQNRLRKLFYYTNPATVSQDQLQEAHFGGDFLDACYLYITDDEFDREAYLRKHSPRPVSRRIRRTALMGIPAVLIIATYLMYCQQVEQVNPVVLPLVEQFDEVSLSALQERGWDVLDIEERFLKQQDNPGYFTLYTLPGSYWVKPEEPIEVPNTLVRSVPREAEGVRVKFDTFVPNQNWQAVAAIVYDQHLNRRDVLMVTFGYANQLAERDLSPYFYSTYRIINGVPMDGSMHQLEVFPDRSDGDALLFEIQWDASAVHFGVRMNREGGFTQEWESIRPLGSLEKPFEPAYIGIVSCQGWTNDNREPLHADTLPVLLDWVEIY